MDHQTWNVTEEQDGQRQAGRSPLSPEPPSWRPALHLHSQSLRDFRGTWREQETQSSLSEGKEPTPMCMCKFTYTQKLTNGADCAQMLQETMEQEGYGRLPGR